jgi:hypothetical protein
VLLEDFIDVIVALLGVLLNVLLVVREVLPPKPLMRRTALESKGTSHNECPSNTPPTKAPFPMLR